MTVSRQHSLVAPGVSEAVAFAVLARCQADLNMGTVLHMC